MATTLTDARRRWVAREPVGEMATALGVPIGTIYYWRKQHRWPQREAVRAPGPTWVLDLPGKRELARKLWREGLPRPDIAALCEISMSTISAWRKRYRWATRPPGTCQLPSWEKVYRHLPHAPPPADAQARRQVLADYVMRLRKKRPAVTPKWRCCDQLHDGPACPTCQRPNPLCV